MSNAIINATRIFYKRLPLNVNIVNKLYKHSKSNKNDCRRALVDIPPDVNPVCPQPCKRRSGKKQGILHKIKLKIIEGGTNFGTPYNRLICKDKVCKEVVPVPKTEKLPEPKVPALPPPRPGVQVAILGADTNLGQYIALLLKQCPCIKKLRLYEAYDTRCSNCSRNLCNVAEDLRHIDTNCQVEAFSCTNNELDRCLQNSDIVLMLENACIRMDMPLVDRFNIQAPIVKKYTDVISMECPQAFIIVCASPVDCMVPLIAETMKETGWYDPRKLLGSLAVPEMRASTLAARALCLEPTYIKVPCVGGTEGNALVPLFSKAVEYFSFSKQNAEMMTRTIRDTPACLARSDGECIKASELSEAHALAGLTSKVAWGLLCVDIPRVTGFVETDASVVVSPARFLGTEVLISSKGICKLFDFPRKMDVIERDFLDLALSDITNNVKETLKWYKNYRSADFLRKKVEARTNFFQPTFNENIESCLHLS